MATRRKPAVNRNQWRTGPRPPRHNRGQYNNGFLHGFFIWVFIGPLFFVALSGAGAVIVSIWPAIGPIVIGFAWVLGVSAVGLVVYGCYLIWQDRKKGK